MKIIAICSLTGDVLKCLVFSTTQRYWVYSKQSKKQNSPDWEAEIGEFVKTDSKWLVDYQN